MSLDWIDPQATGMHNYRAGTLPPVALQGCTDITRVCRRFYFDASPMFHRVPKIIDFSHFAVPLRTMQREGLRAYVTRLSEKLPFTELQLVSFENVILKLDRSEIEEHHQNKLRTALLKSTVLKSVCIWLSPRSLDDFWNAETYEQFALTVRGWMLFFRLNHFPYLKRGMDVWVDAPVHLAETDVFRRYGERPAKSTPVLDVIGGLTETRYNIGPIYENAFRSAVVSRSSLNPATQPFIPLQPFVFTQPVHLVQPTRPATLTPECWNCLSVFATRRRLFQHIRDLGHDKRLPPRSFEPGFIHRVHESGYGGSRAGGPPEQHKCPMCLTAFETNDFLLRHLRVSHFAKALPLGPTKKAILDQLGRTDDD